MTRTGRAASSSTGTLTAPQRSSTKRAAAAAPSDQRTARVSGTQRAYARREERLRRLTGGPSTRAAATSGRAQFVLLVMALLGSGLVATLWLSTAAAADSYRLQDARNDARLLSSQSERLHREVASMESAPELAERAASIGMVPVQDPARLVLGPDGSVSVVGEPAPAMAQAPPVPLAAPRVQVPVPVDAAGQAAGGQPAPPVADAAGNGGAVTGGAATGATGGTGATGATGGTGATGATAGNAAATGDAASDDAAGTSGGAATAGDAPSGGAATSSGAGAAAGTSTGADATPSTGGTATGTASGGTAGSAGASGAASDTPPPIGAPGTDQATG